MDFFDRQARAKKQTRLLLWLFGLAVGAMVLVNNLLIASAIYCIQHPVLGGYWWHPASFLATVLFLFGEAVVHPLHFLKLILHRQSFSWITVGTLLSIAAGSFYKIRQLAAGGSTVAELLGGRRIEARTDDLDEQRLRNVISEMAIASGTSVPEIYVLDNERGINAFAAGHTRDDVAIGVTRGCMKLLTRDELQGIIAHEFSHILNGDTRLNMKLIGLAHGLFWPTLLGRTLIYGSADELPPDNSFFVDEDQSKILPTTPIGLIFVMLGSTSLPAVRLLKSAICRQREWLADAAAVQFTRNPEGIAGALEKIGGLFKQGRLDTPHAEVASHLYFANSNYEPWFAFLATHPPLPERISAINPRFDGNFPQVKMLAPNQFERDQAFEQVVGNALATERTLSENALAARGVTVEHVRQISMMRLGLPMEVKLALRTADGATAIVYCLLLSDDDVVRSQQIQLLHSQLAAGLFAQTTALAPQIAELGDRYKLVLAEFAVPALRENNSGANDTFHQTLRRLIECDGAIDLFEFTLMKMVARQLRAHFSGTAPASVRYGRVRDLVPECTLLLSALAHVGHEEEADARSAFAKGAEFLDAPKAQIQFLPRSEWDLDKVDAALSRLATYHEPLKRNILMACGRTVAVNGRVTEREAELLRAIADALDCPVPPFVDAIRMEELSRETST